MIINQNFHQMITRKYGVLKHRQLRSPALIFLSLNRAIPPFHRLLKEITIIRQNKHISHYHHYHYANYPVTLNLFSRIFPKFSKEHSRQAEPLEKNFFHFPNFYKFMSTHITASKSLSFAEPAKGLKKPGTVEGGGRNTPQQNQQESKTYLTVARPLSLSGKFQPINIEVNKNFYRYPGLLLEPPIVLKKPGTPGEPSGSGPGQRNGATVPGLKHFNPSAVVPAHITETVHRVKKNIIESETITQKSSSFSTSRQGNTEAEANGKITVNVGQLTEQVYRMLMHKIKVEKERRGL